MARLRRFQSRFSWLRIVILLTACSLGLAQTANPQAVKPASGQSPQTPATSGSPGQSSQAAAASGSATQSSQVSAGSGSTLQAPLTPQPNAPAIFLVAPTVPTSGAPGSVATGDLNGDGNLDLVVANFDTGKISVLLGQGNGKFVAPADYLVGKQPAFVLVADVNGDGKLDVVVCNETDGTLSVLLGNGDGTLQNPATYRTAPDPVYVVMGDLNGDGKPDLAVAGNASQTIAVMLNDGAGSFSKAVPYNIGRAPRSLAVADFDGDGHPDLASANADGSVSILLGRGDGTFRAISSLNVASVPLSSIASGDFNGDGKPDLAVTQAGTKLLTVLLGKGDGTFQNGAPYAVGSNPACVLVVDVNGDNVPDLVTANQSGNTFSVLLGNGDGTFKPSLDFTAGNSPRALAAGDFNRDGHTDLAVVNFSDHTISLPLGNGDGTFQAAHAYNVDLDRKSVAAGDLDGDGKPDLVVTNFCGNDTTCASNGTVSVLLAVGDGTYKFAASYPLGAGPLSVALADVNGDKKLDLIAVNRGDKSVSVLLGNGDGTFRPALTYPAGTSPVAVAVGDFSKDGKIDLAIAGDCGSSACTQSGEVSVLLGNGDGSFQSAATYAVGYSPTSIFAGDVNGDANLDLVVSNACGKDSSCKSNGTATVLLGDGKGGFTSGGDFQLGNSPSAVVLGDLNGDGALDLVAAYKADNKVGVLLGNGDGTFKPQVTYQVGTAPSAVVFADFNGDGKGDVAVANFKDSRVSVLFGNGDGTLQAAVHYPVGLGPESLIAIDPNNTGHADLVSANGNGGTTPKGSDITVLRNLSGGLAMASTVVFRTNGAGPVTYGQELGFRAVVSGDGSSGTPTGTVDFTGNGNMFDPNCTGVVLQKVDNNTARADCKSTMVPAGNPTAIVANYSGDGTYQGDSSPPFNQVVNQANATISVTPYTVTYDGNPHTATGTATGVNGEDLSADLDLSGTTHTNAGDYPNDPWTFHDPNGNYNDANGTVHDVINEANANITVTPYSVAYDGNPHAATGTATCGGQDLSADLDLSKTTHTNAGDYPMDPWTFHDPTGNCNDANGTVHDVINKANADITVTPYTVTYDGNPHTATGTAKCGNQDLSGDLDLSKTTHTNAGNYPNDPWTFHDPNGNCNDANGTVADLINQAMATITVTGYTVTYDGNPHTATGTATGVKGEDLSADLNLSGTTHTNAGNYANDPWTFHDPNGNYMDANGTVADLINQATATITVTGYTVTYDGNPHTATGKATGVNGEDLSADLNLSGTTHTNAGNYANDPWTFHDPNGNYMDASGTVADLINQAMATITVTGYTVTYDGNPHTATGKATGLKGEDLSADLNLSGTTHTNAGNYPNDPWTFHDPNGNYMDANGTVADVINKATANIAVTPYTVTYDANPHTAVGTATGVKGEDLSADLNLSGTTHTNAGDYPKDPWTFHDPNGNYSDANGTVHDAINKATAKFSGLASQTIMYGAPSIFLSGVLSAPGPVYPPMGDQVTITIKGQPPVIATISDNTGDFSATYATNRIPVSGSPYTITYSYDSNGSDPNFNSATDSSTTLTVIRADTTTTPAISPTPTSVLGQVVTITATVAGKAYGGFPKGGSVTFTYGNGSTIPECKNPITLNNGQAACSTGSLPFGQQTVTVTYSDSGTPSDDGNFNSSSSAAIQTVQDFVLAVSGTPVNVVQSFTNYPQSVSLSLTPRHDASGNNLGYNGTVSLMCAVTGLTCSVSNDCSNSQTNICISPATIPMGTGGAAVKITTKATTPIGSYLVTVTGQDVVDTGAPNSNAFAVVVGTFAAQQPVAPNQPGVFSVPFTGSSTGVTFACVSVTGASDVTCASFMVNFSPTSTPLNPQSQTAVTITIGLPQQSARLAAPARILATLWLAMPAIVLIGSLRYRKLSRKNILQLLGMLLLLIALLQGIGCGGGFNRQAARLTPGPYQMLVEGSDANGVQTSAVIPFNVTD